MAGGSVIGALRVVLGLDSADLDKGLKSSQDNVRAFGSSVSSAMATATAAITTAALGIGVAIKKNIDQFDNLSKASQKIGVPVEELSALRHAAELSDVSMESLQKGVGRLAKNLVEGAQGAEAPIEAFGALGISVRNADGSIKTVSQALPEIADKFERMRDGPEKTALSMKLLGKSGMDLIPMLNGGAAGLKEMTDEAKALGLVISTDTGRTAEAFNDNLTRLKAVLTGVFTQVTANVLPALATFSQFLIDGAKNSGFLQVASSALTTGFNALARVAIVVYDNLGLVLKIGAVFVGAQIGAAAISFGLAFVKMAAAIRATGIVMGAFELIRGITMRGMLLMAGIVALAAGAFDGFSDKISKIGSIVSNLMPEGSGEKVKEILGALGLNLEGLTADLTKWQNVSGKNGGGLFNPDLANKTKDALDQYLSSQRKAIAGHEAEAASIGKSAAELAALRIIKGADAVAEEKGIKISAERRKEIEATAKAAANAQLTIQANQLTEEMNLPWVTRNQKLQEYNNLLLLGKISSDTFAAAQATIQFPSFTSAANAAMDFGARLDELATTTVNGLSSAISGLITGTKSAAEAFSAFAKQIISDIAAMIVKMLIFKALKSALGWGLPFADGGSVGTGFSLTGTGGLFADGGSVWGAGTATSDSIPAMLSNGEFVVNSKAADQNRGLLTAINEGKMPERAPIAGGSGRTISVAGIDPGKLFTGETVRSLIEALHGAQRDGYKLSPA